MTKVNNLPKDVEKYVVAREVDGELWFWGSFETEGKAIEASSQFFNGFVLERQEIER